MRFSLGKLHLLSILALVASTSGVMFSEFTDEVHDRFRFAATMPVGEIENAPKKNDSTTDDADAKTSDDAKSKSDSIPKLATSDDDSDEPAAKVEIFIPSVLKLARAAEKSRTAELFEAVRGLIPTPPETTDEESFDVKALVQLSERILKWPDTAIVFATYSQDRDGRPRWALRLDWELAELKERLDSILKDEAAAKILGDVKLTRADDDHWQIELDDMVLAHLRQHGTGSAIVATADLQPPSEAFGEEERKTKNSKKSTLVFCRLNLAAEEEDQGNPLFSQIAGVESIDYELQLQTDGSWREMFRVQWNALIGAMAKAVLQKTKDPFECPKDSYVCAALNLGTIGTTLPDSLSGMTPGTLGPRTNGDMAVAVMPGTGFLPLPDTFYQFRTGRRHGLVENIRDAIKEDTTKRREDDRRPAWNEETVDGELAFWRDPTADGGGGFRPATMRTIVFFDPPLSESERNGESTDDDKDKSDDDSDDDDAEKEVDRRVVIAVTSTWADDAIRNYRNGMKSTVKLPSAKAIDWQGRIRWRNAYELAFPYVSILTGMSEDVTLPPAPADLADALADSRIDMKIGFSGFFARHKGPIPIGAVYIPAIAGMTLSESADPSSEIARERVACRRLRVLQYHAKLFNKDYGRWPATVAELDGYVDFASHPYLLQLRDKKSSVMSGFVSMFTVDKDDTDPKESETQDDDAIDDSLYEIDWAETAGDWRLKFRVGEFVKYDTIAIDGNGDLHRIEKSREKKELARSGAANNESEDDDSPKL